MGRIYEDTHEAIVDKETWDAVQKRFSEGRRARQNSTGEISLFSGIVKCADCKSPLTFTYKCYSGREYFLYRCSKYINNGKNVCTIHSISLEQLEKIVLEDIKNNAILMKNEDIYLLDKLVKLSNGETNKLIEQYNSTLFSKQQRLTEVEKLIQNCFEEKSNGILKEKTFIKLLSKYENEEAELTLEIEKMKVSIDSTKIEVENIQSTVEKLKEYINITKLERYIVCELIDSITVSEPYEMDGIKKQDVKINYKFIGCLKEYDLCG